MPKPSNRTRAELLLPGLLLAAYIAVRIAALVHFWNDLNTDPDAYLSLGRQIQAGHGFSAPGTNLPTAYRPPLYPLLVAAVSAPDQTLQRGLLNLLLSLITLVATWQVARQLGLSFIGQLLACGIVAFDPLSIRYVAFPMTETLCASLVACLLILLTARPRGYWQALALGLTFGLCVLSRPTFWIFAAMYVPLWGLLRWRRTSDEDAAPAPPGRVRSLLVIAGVVLCVAPWVLRNVRQLHAPIVMTTHGGYTLLLGNNPAFYREVVDQPWGTIWDGSHGPGQAGWITDTLAQSQQAGVHGEVELDRWMSAQAWQTIRAQPQTFLRACLRKFCWFWNLGPQGPAAAGLPALVLWGIRLFYIGFWVLALRGVVHVCGLLARNPNEGARWLAPLVLVASLSLAHLVYWSDARMRTPVVPALALLAALGATRRPNSSAVKEPASP